MAGVTNAVANSGQIQAGRVVMEAQTADDIFEDAINQTGEVKATQMVDQDGVIKIVANGDVQVSGTLQAPGGKIEISSTERSVRIEQALAAAAQEVKSGRPEISRSMPRLARLPKQRNISAGKNIIINAPVATQGNTTIKAKNNIVVKANITTDSGNLSLMADSDLNGIGAFLQAPARSLKPRPLEISLFKASGPSAVANIRAAGSLNL